MDCTCAVVTGSTVRVAINVPFSVAMICTVVCVGTVRVLIENVAEREPAGIVNVELATVATLVFELESATVTPPDGAAAEIVTVPVEVPFAPPSTSTGESVREVTLGAGGGCCAVTAFGTPEQAIDRELRVAISMARHSWWTGLMFLFPRRRKGLSAL